MASFIVLEEVTLDLSARETKYIMVCKRLVNLDHVVNIIASDTGKSRVILSSLSADWDYNPPLVLSESFLCNMDFDSLIERIKDG